MFILLLCGKKLKRFTHHYTKKWIKYSFSFAKIFIFAILNIATNNKS